MDDNKEFWKKIKPLFTGKSKAKTNITLIDQDEIITDKNEVAETLNKHFIESVQNLGIEKFSSNTSLSHENAESADMISI